METQTAMETQTQTKTPRDPMRITGYMDADIYADGGEWQVRIADRHDVIPGDEIRAHMSGRGYMQIICGGIVRMLRSDMVMWVREFRVGGSDKRWISGQPVTIRNARHIATSVGPDTDAADAERFCHMGQCRSCGSYTHTDRMGWCVECVQERWG